MANLKSKRSAETRTKIVRAFETCIAANGYAHTKLLDIADAAGLAPPHLRYYFKNKESILEYQYERLVAGFERALNNIQAADTFAWFETLARMLFDDDHRSPQAVIVLIEGNSLAGRSDRMRRIKQRYDVETRAIIAQKIRALGADEADLKAEVIFHFLSGLILNTAFETKKSRSKAVALVMRFVRGFV